MLEMFARATLVDWVALLCAGGMALVKLGEWKRGLDARRNGSDSKGYGHGNSYSQEARLQAIEARVMEYKRVLDGAGEKTSHLATRVQALVGRVDRMPEDLRAKFLPLDRAEDLFGESRRDRDMLRQRLEHLERGPR